MDYTMKIKINIYSIFLKLKFIQHFHIYNYNFQDKKCQTAYNGWKIKTVNCKGVGIYNPAKTKVILNKICDLQEQRYRELCLSV